MKQLIQVSLVMLVAIAGVAGTAHAQAKVGTTAAPFLGISVGPRATGMGGAFVASGTDASAMYWNPGALSRSAGSQILGATTDWLVDTKFNWVGFKLALDRDNAIGLSVTQLDYGEDIVTTVSQPEGTGERWTAQDIAVGITYSRNLTDRFSIGGTLKYISQRIWNESATAIAVDLGLMFVTPFDGMRLGMSLSNFGSDMQLQGRDLVRRIDLDPEATGNNNTIVASLKTDGWELPLFVRAGVAYDVFSSQDFLLIAAGDAVLPSDNNLVVNVGGELSFQNMLFVRAGYKSLFLADAQEGLTAGIGVLYPIFGSTAASIDFTYQDFGVFDSVTTITFGVTF